MQKENEWAKKADTRKAEFPAVSETRKATGGSYPLQACKGEPWIALNSE